jgi:predicted enzyme related to lactoylglutathione lyase
MRRQLHSDDFLRASKTPVESSPGKKLGAVRLKIGNHQLENIMSENDKPSMGQPGRFCWNELVTTDVAAAKKFYTKLLGWTTEAFGKSSDYTLFKQGAASVGGLMKCPEPGNPARWIPYVIVADVDVTAAKTSKLVGKVLVPPSDVHDVGRIAVLADPQGAAFGIIKPDA